MKCPTCGDELKVIVVQVPVMTLGKGTLLRDNKPVLTAEGMTVYEDRDEFCDCPRCQGAY